MDFNIKTGKPEKLVSDCLVLPVFSDGKTAFGLLGREATEYVQQLCKSGDFSGALGETLLLYRVPGLRVARLLLVGCGNARELTQTKYVEILHKAAGTINKLVAKNVVCLLTALEVTGVEVTTRIKLATISLLANAYRFTACKSRDTEGNKAVRRKRVSWWVSEAREVKAAEVGLKHGLALDKGLGVTKDLANTPPNICTPEYLAKAARQVGKTYRGIKVKVVERAEMQRLGMGALLSVARGSVHPPKLITLEYSGGSKKQAPIVLVGKGITFDTGGNSLKPATGMIGMKYDMCGAAAVLGILTFAAELGLKLNLVGVMAAAENMPGGNASRPDDVVTTMSGLTVEILNTDAEGRLVLCDALTYCAKFKPGLVIDMATLTGACITALGSFHAGLMGNDQELANALLNAGLKSGDRCWQLPLTEEYVKLIDSNCADIANIGNGEAGTITGAAFLSKFTQKYRWAHLDIAGTACKYTGKDRAATGSPVPMLSEFLLSATDLL